MRSVSQGIFVFAGLVLIALLSNQEAKSATYYVATTGNDTTGDGSISRPWLTVPKGIRSLRASDTLYIRGGTYYMTGIYGNSASDTYGCVPACPTSWDTATKIKNYPGEVVVLNSYGFNMDNRGAAGGVAYLIWEGDRRENFIHQQNGTGGDYVGIRVNNDVHHVRLKTMTVRNFSSMGIQGGTSTNCTLKPTFIEIIDNEVRGNGDETQEVGPYEHGIYPACGDRWTISQNYAVGNSAYGIHVNNTIAAACTNFLIERNTVEGRKDPTGTAAGIVVTTGSGHIIRNNVIIGQGAQRYRLTVGIELAWGVTGADVLNNTVHDVGSGIQVINSTNVSAINNILSKVSVNLDLFSSTITAQNNLCTASQSGCAVITTAPGFVLSGSNFRLATGSPAVDAGTSLSAVTNDRDGMRRPAGVAFDIGAYEGGASSTALSPPQNLRVN
jgi:hypothetical protein